MDHIMDHFEKNVQSSMSLWDLSGAAVVQTVSLPWKTFCRHWVARSCRQQSGNYDWTPGRTLLKPPKRQSRPLQLKIQTPEKNTVLLWK